MKSDTRAGSLPYMEAGERMRVSQTRLVAAGAKVNLRAWRVAGAVWGLTAGYSKAWDAVFVDALAELTGMDERSVRRGIKDCVAAGALQWLPSHQGKRGRPSLIGLPESGPSKPGVAPVRAVEARAVTARLPSVEVISNEGSDSHGGEQVPAPVAHRSQGSTPVLPEDWEVESDTGPQARPDPELRGMTREELVRLWYARPEAHDGIRAEMERRETRPDPYADLDPAIRRHFGLDNPDGWHGDERTGDGIGDDEASQMRWRAANPSKVRARRDGG
jgi:hypothetical protein